MTIRPAEPADLPAFFVYLDDHLRDNGRDGAPLFQPLSRAQSQLPPGLRVSFIEGLVIPVGEAGWRRLWLALDERGAIAGHIDLRARPEPLARHRTMLGMGVHRAWRRRGLGAQLLDTAIAWARSQDRLKWIDLEVLSENHPAVSLYLRAGFTMTARIEDMLQIDGVSHDLSYMRYRLR
ncbi:GCN5 family acetyltransferase [Massilia sp. WF1]|uniref:GNAT family N-acetyltransferase n=1 Tax=unclassified Massilia TaxID=2609279 RepID=UPI0006493E43|nr:MULTISPECIES: GNAT family N-acetyltransferase [unclassified Massilia]ALK95014.1 GCN5 family acetyltransferase [Massilia sp. WG5]KLU38432.1 GCN5 family acetyltransferase [Massilia sp. WF1]